jgi:hypothetical protein
VLARHFEHDRHDSAFGEVTIRGTARRNTWVGGVAVERDAYRARELVFLSAQASSGRHP